MVKSTRLLRFVRRRGQSDQQAEQLVNQSPEPESNASSLSPYSVFDPEWYLAQIGEPHGIADDPFEHYLTIGWRKGIAPHPLFDLNSPAALAAPSGVEPLGHYLATPSTWRLAPHERFDPDYYLDTNVDIRDAKLNPLEHYVMLGEVEGRPPSADFNIDLYLYLTGLESRRGALAHFIAGGSVFPEIEEPPIEIPQAASPTVSIILIASGEWEQTKSTLQGISDSETETAFEVIVVDNTQSDQTLTKLQKIANLKVITPRSLMINQAPTVSQRSKMRQKHLGDGDYGNNQQSPSSQVSYAEAVNSALKLTATKFVVILRDTVIPQEGWLDALVNAAEVDGVGVVGGKRLSDDGFIETAGYLMTPEGGVVKSGERKRADHPLYNYRHPVDFLSDTALLLTQEYINQAPIIDAEFSSALYVDADIAFAARANSLAVIYEPGSVVISQVKPTQAANATFSSIRDQQRDRVRFAQKWAPSLEMLTAEVGDTESRGTRRKGGVVVIVDQQLPQWDEDAGSVRMAAIIAQLQASGYEVVFIPSNKYPTQPYLERLQQAGVIVWWGHEDYFPYLREIAKRIEFVWIARAQSGLSHLRDLKTLFPEVPVIFDTVDLHFLREEREAEMGLGSPISARITRELELALMRVSEITVVVSDAEKALLSKLVPDSEIHVLPTIHPAQQKAVPEGRTDISFVGNFQHPPNVDALKWFLAEVLPQIIQTIPEVKVKVVGRNPPAELVAGVPDNVEFLGWVEDLAPIHRRSRVSIAPLRYGAGVKGKIGDAWAHGVPVVTTSIGVEGMSAIDGTHALVRDDANDFAAAVVELLKNDTLWQEISEAAQLHCDVLLGNGRLRTELANLTNRAREIAPTLAIQ